MIIAEHFDLDKPTDCKRVNNRRKTSFFYVIRIHKGRERFLKVGTTTKTLANRLSHYKYNGYTIDKIYYAVELSEATECYTYEYEYIKALSKRAGLVHVPKDRFHYYQIPKNLFEIIAEINQSIAEGE